MIYPGEDETPIESEDSKENIEIQEEQDVSLTPGPNADKPDVVQLHIPEHIRTKYDIYSYRHAATILATSFPDELNEILQALEKFSITTRDIGAPGGNESVIPKKFSEILRPLGWVESKIQGDLLVRIQQYGEVTTEAGKIVHEKQREFPPIEIKNFIDGHKIDYVKGRVAFDMEWNSKDQTFDRDLYAMRAFHECGLISAGIMVTRSHRLNPVFNVVQQLDKRGEAVLHADGKKKGQPKTVRAKYGASTTWMGKLLYRLNAGRHGGCPILVFGITPQQIEDWKQK